MPTNVPADDRLPRTFTPPADAPRVPLPGAAPAPTVGAPVGEAPIADAPLADARSAGHGDPEDELPRGTTPTYELEMLISGAVTFGLLQLPAMVDAQGDALMLQMPSSSRPFLVVGWILAKAMLFALIGAFLLHAATRAYWVGLVGLDSVYPKGVQWERLTTTGPITRAEFRSRMPTLPTLIARLDNVASTIFSVAFLLVQTVLFAALALVVLYGAQWAITRVLPSLGALHPMPFVLLAVPAVAVVGALVDRLFGARMAPDGTPARVLRGVAGAMYRVTGTALYGPVMYTLVTNARKRVAIPLVYAGIAATMTLATRDVLRHLGIARTSDGAYLPERLDVRSVSASAYDALRGESHGVARTPSIQSDIVEGPYVRLFVPYDGERDDAALRAACPEIARLAGRAPARARTPAVLDTAAYDRVLACLARVRAVTIDGAAVPNIAYRFHVHPATGLRGVVAYIPTDGLARGMHTLLVRAAPGPSGDAHAPAEIPFWR